MASTTEPRSSKINTFAGQNTYFGLLGNQVLASESALVEEILTSELEPS
jgi:hypothetical protein